MYYNRTISANLSAAIEAGGKLRWLFDFVKNHKALDFLIGKNNSKEWISVYRGLSRIISLLAVNSASVFVDADKKYKSMTPNLFGNKDINIDFSNEIEDLITLIEKDSKLNRYYNNKKEGFYQNELSRKYGICGNPDDDFVIIDKEVVIGYKNNLEKDYIFGKLQKKYKLLQNEISYRDSVRFGKNLEKKAIGNELDFLALDKKGNILLIEYKHGTNTSGIYLSPLQIGLYYDIFYDFPINDLTKAIFEMLDQKQKIGLINPKWNRPPAIKDIIPVLIISEYNYKSSAKIKYDEILQIIRKETSNNFLSNIQTYNYTNNNLVNW